ncbi:replication initiation protein [Alteromonas halophila]|uniref:Uncharacterized protein n=1 Tax=Alteromonas halophila TaxID=516698 RepID=A0A918JSR4_9ALTE|nr:replication initiation protein [Alteromonas halophila]GGW95325.1 hypothetical protein GCM10007391_32000 [Alteromonas halophila]
MTSEMIQPVLAAPSCAQTILTERLKRTTPPQSSSASEEKKKSRRRFRDTALTYLHVQVNPPGNVCWLIFDLDDVHPLEWQEKLLPPPNIIVSKPVPEILKKDEKEYSAHLFYAIQNVPTTRAANRAPIGFVNDVRRKMRITLGADRDYTGPL